MNILLWTVSAFGIISLIVVGIFTASVITAIRRQRKVNKVFRSRYLK